MRDVCLLNARIAKTRIAWPKSRWYKSPQQKAPSAPRGAAITGQLCIPRRVRIADRNTQRIADLAKGVTTA
jgi:hypothetical protein